MAPLRLGCWKHTGVMRRQPRGETLGAYPAGQVESNDQSGKCNGDYASCSRCTPIVVFVFRPHLQSSCRPQPTLLLKSDEPRVKQERWAVDIRSSRVRCTQ